MLSFSCSALKPLLRRNYKSDGADFLINPPADFITCQKLIPDYFNNCVLPKDVVDIKK
ncbi:MAG TPA: hypothetical protein PLE33_03020 [Candidatus Cloacimonas sp.]|jgi:hypothetical protein|nr:hypothetical protein [Candidatus Cloacimonas sp.]HPS60217.1 hypothetical protein [Candidatus Cloacimonas sp.]